MKKSKPIKYSIYDGGHVNVVINFHINRSPYTIRHTHDYWEMNIMLKNDCLNCINGVKENLYHGELQLIRPDDLHWCEVGNSVTHELLNIEIRTEYFLLLMESLWPGLSEKFLSCDPKIPKISLKQETMVKIMRLLSLAQRYSEINNIFRQYYSKQIVVFLLMEFIEDVTEEYIKKDMEDDVCYRLISLMSDPKNIALKLNELCELFPCNVEFAIRHFKAEGLKTPNKVFKDIKLDYACGLLKTTDFKIITIANMCGFNNIAYFNKIFIERFLITPKEYRKKYFRS
ncbi:MAG: helix-turn-helix domain-containing protein [Clostridia bacterium]|nr:helix-turn-helix domain-containing protein [Clostridia bacterium]